MLELIYTQLLVTHIIAVMVAVGTVTVTDYLHLLGLRDPVLERRTLFVFPHLSNLIKLALVVIYITGIAMLIVKPEFLQKPLFQIKAVIVIVITINGYILHHHIFPKVEKSIKTKSYPPKLIRQAAFAGSLSVVSWYGIVILAMTKEMGYTPLQFLVVYFLALAFAFGVALFVESKKTNEPFFFS